MDGRILGYAGAWVIMDECHITNIAVDSQARGKGLGRLLIEALMQYTSNLGAAWADLEVRVSNIPAIRLYESVGFFSVGKRKRYYEDNGEDAFLMVCQRMPAVNPDFTDEAVETEEKTDNTTSGTSAPFRMNSAVGETEKK